MDRIQQPAIDEMHAVIFSAQAGEKASKGCRSMKFVMTRRGSKTRRAASAPQLRVTFSQSSVPLRRQKHVKFRVRRVSTSEPA
jgi:hypothetical protein